MDAQVKIIPHRYEVEYQVSPPLKKSEVIDGYEFNVRGQKTYVKVNFTTKEFNEILPDSEGEYEYAEQTIARKEALKIRGLMLERMVYQRAYRPIKIEIVSGPTLLNKNEFPIEKRFTGNKTDIKYNVLDVNSSIEESHNFWLSGFKNKARGYEEDAFRIADWIQRSGEESDGIKSFIIAWIGFNGLYGLFASINGKNRDNDASKMDNIVKELVKSYADQIVADCAKQLDELQSYNVISQTGNTNWSEDLKLERQNASGNSIEIIKKAVRCIYGIRGQVFHEAPQPKDIENRSRVSKEMLIPIVAACLKNFINC